MTLLPSEVLARRRKTIDDGSNGALQFTKTLLRTAELGAKPPQLLEAVQALLARSWMLSLGRHRLR